MANKKSESKSRNEAHPGCSGIKPKTRVEGGRWRRHEPLSFFPPEPSHFGKQASVTNNCEGYFGQMQVWVIVFHLFFSPFIPGVLCFPGHNEPSLCADNSLCIIIHACVCVCVCTHTCVCTHNFFSFLFSAFAPKKPHFILLPSSPWEK